MHTNGRGLTCRAIMLLLFPPDECPERIAGSMSVCTHGFHPPHPYPHPYPQSVIPIAPLGGGGCIKNDINDCGCMSESSASPWCMSVGSLDPGLTPRLTSTIGRHHHHWCPPPARRPVICWPGVEALSPHQGVLGGQCMTYVSKTSASKAVEK